MTGAQLSCLDLLQWTTAISFQEVQQLQSGASWHRPLWATGWTVLCLNPQASSLAGSDSDCQ